MITPQQAGTPFVRAQRLLDSAELPADVDGMSEFVDRVQEAIDIIREICDDDGPETDKQRARNLFVTVCRRWCVRARALVGETLPDIDSVDVAKACLGNAASILKQPPFVEAVGQAEQRKELEELMARATARAVELQKHPTLMDRPKRSRRRRTIADIDLSKLV